MPRINPCQIAALRQESDSPTDFELLHRFFLERDSCAFELLVWHHAALVLRVCRGILRDRHEAEDAAQATFLALAKQAGSIRCANLAGWLFRVASRVSRRAVLQQRKRPVTVNFDLDQFPANTEISQVKSEVEQPLFDEVARLPERYQLPLLLCYFEGHTFVEAARQLDCPVGTVAGRVARAKKILEARLLRRGVTLTSIILTTHAIPPSFACNTSALAKAFSQGSTIAIKKSVLQLAQREMRGLMIVKFLRCSCVLAGCITALSFGWATDPQSPASFPGTLAQKETEGKQQPAVPKPPAIVVEKTYAIAPVTSELQRTLTPFRPAPVAMVFVNAAALHHDAKTIDLKEIDLGKIEKELTLFKPDKNKLIHFTSCYLGQVDINEFRAGMDLLQFGWVGLGQRAGFGSVKSDLTLQSLETSWEKFIAPLGENADAITDEKTFGDERVQAYRVQTPLSRLLVGKVDGVIIVQDKLDTRKEDWISAELEKSANAAIAALKFPKGKNLIFIFQQVINERDNQTLDRIRALGKRWAENHGLVMESFRL